MEDLVSVKMEQIEEPIARVLIGKELITKGLWSKTNICGVSQRVLNGGSSPGEERDRNSE